MNRPDPARLLGERGTSLVFALLVLFGLLSLTVAALHSSTFDLKTSSNYFTSAQALLAAESGLLHAQKTINDPGVIAFDRDVVTPWSTLFGTASRAIPGYSSVQYSVTAAADATDPARFALL